MLIKNSNLKPYTLTNLIFSEIQPDLHISYSLEHINSIFTVDFVTNHILTILLRFLVWTKIR